MAFYLFQFKVKEVCTLAGETNTAVGRSFLAAEVATVPRMQL
jgi:hypothetical protein